MRVLVTRPQPQADDWVARLRAEGVDACALPLIEIGDPADAAPVRDAWRALGGHALAVFVSPNAVARFFAQRPAGSAWPAATWAGATGPGTSAALAAAGVPAASIVEPPADGGQFDSEALWTRLAPLRDWRGAQALIVRGEGGRDWLAGTLQSQGAQVRFVEAYCRMAPRLDAPQRALLAEAAARPAQHLWLLSSSEAIGHLGELAPGANWREARALASHPRIAATARALGFGHVEQVGPAFSVVLEAVKRA
jgi:uroporphyrinogen-III synthase